MDPELGIMPVSRMFGRVCGSLKDTMEKAIARTVRLEFGLRVQCWGCRDNCVGPVLVGWSLTSPLPPHLHEPDFSSLFHKSLIYSLHHSQWGLISCVRACLSAPALAPRTGQTCLGRYELMWTRICTATRLVQVHTRVWKDCSSLLDSDVLRDTQ